MYTARFDQDEFECISYGSDNHSVRLRVVQRNEVQRHDDPRNKTRADNTRLHCCLFDCELPTGSVERWSTHEVILGGTSYHGRVLKHNVFDIRSAPRTASMRWRRSL